MGWLRVCQVLFANYGCSTSRSHATYTRTPDYVTVPEEAAPRATWLRSVTREHILALVGPLCDFTHILVLPQAR